MLDAHTQKRLVAFLLGLSIAAFGVGLIVKSELGVSPVMSVPYVVSLYLPFTFGTCVAAEQIILLALQKVILKSDFKLKALWQFPTAVFFGVLCDAALFDGILRTYFGALPWDLYFGYWVVFSIYGKCFGDSARWLYVSSSPTF